MRWNSDAKEKISCRCDVSFFGKFVIDSRLSFGLRITFGCSHRVVLWKMNGEKREKKAIGSVSSFDELASLNYKWIWYTAYTIRTITANLFGFNNIATAAATARARTNAIANNNINFNRIKSCLLKLSLEIWRVTGFAMLLSWSHICHYKYFSCCSLCCLKFSFFLVSFLLYHKSSFVSLLMPFTRFPVCVAFSTSTTTTASTMPMKPNNNKRFPIYQCALYN